VDGRRLRLLVVDDAESVRQVLAELLQLGGYEVELAADAEEALQLARLVRWDGLVLDYDLPGLNGAELYARIRRDTGQRLPVIFFTGRPHAMLQLGLGGAPWARVVPKPCGGRQLLAALEQCLRAGAETAPATGD
jgi:two-component system response regulator MprA